MHCLVCTFQNVQIRTEALSVAALNFVSLSTLRILRELASIQCSSHVDCVQWIMEQKGLSSGRVFDLRLIPGSLVHGIK